MTMHKRMATAGAFTLLLAVGCAGPPASDGARPPGPPPAPSREVRALVLPLDAYQLDGRSAALAATAQEKLTTSCMARQGLDWPELPHPVTKTWPNRGRYGLAEPAVAARYGYRPIPDPASAAAERAMGQRDAGLTARQRKAAYGADGQSGCAARAQHELMRDVPKVNSDLVNEASLTAYKKSQQAPAVQKVFAAWRACMRGRGHDYRDPMAPNDDARWTGEHPTRAETATAQDDVECKLKTHLVPVWWRADAALQHQTIKDHAERFQRIGDARNRYLENAQRHSRTGSPDS
ncbi:hypothetical protein AB0O76_43860 [Streptomyces sp. NPDC086554]|uniref:hypothetical protein n=1 Tax=Streptomyces sp. NPDC086554 TaxID=3154864 RepID=UPI0034284FB1